MDYSDFTLQSIETRFGVKSCLGPLFTESPRVEVPVWLRDFLSRTLRLPLVSEKARSELIVMPVLLGCRELSSDSVSILSGSRLDVEAEQGLVGECDFLLSRTAPLPEVRAPLLAVVEAKKNDVEAGLGQYVAQMIGARLFNERGGRSGGPVYGCVTSGEVWQFLCLDGQTATIDQRRYYLHELEFVLGVLMEMVGGATKSVTTPT